jgi:hypothetical protein
VSCSCQLPSLRHEITENHVCRHTKAGSLRTHGQADPFGETGHSAATRISAKYGVGEVGLLACPTERPSDGDGGLPPWSWKDPRSLGTRVQSLRLDHARNHGLCLAPRDYFIS